MIKNNKSFFINSNICIKESDIKDFASFMDSIACNIGNSYITYSLIKELDIQRENFEHIQNIYKFDESEIDNTAENINSNFDNVFLILQDQIRISESYGLKLPYEKIIKLVNKINKPIIIAGLGANTRDNYDANFHKKLDNELIKF